MRSTSARKIGCLALPAYGKTAYRIENKADDLDTAKTQ
jgi:hypothetical protein